METVWTYFTYEKSSILPADFISTCRSYLCRLVLYVAKPTASALKIDLLSLQFLSRAVLSNPSYRISAGWLFIFSNFVSKS